jgi:hypothetical protein
LLFILATIVPPSALGAQLIPAPVIDTELKEGMTSLEGRFSIPPPGTNVTMAIVRRHRDGSSPISNILINVSRGTFLARLDNGDRLMSGDRITVVVHFNGKGSESTTVAVAAGPKKEITLEIPKEGQSEIRGTTANITKLRLVVFGEGIATMTGLRQGLDAARRELGSAEDSLLSAQKAEPGSPSIQVAQDSQRAAERKFSNELIALVKDDRLISDVVLFEEEVAVSGNTFKVTLPQALDVGLTVLAFDPTAEDAARYRTVQSIAINYGRFRGTFLLGGTVGPSASKSSTDIYLGFYGEGFLAARLLNKDSNGPTPNKNDDFFLRFRTELRTFGEVRMTQTGTSSGSSTISSVRSSFTQFGMYAPVHWKGLDWTFRGTPHSWFVAPMIKMGGVVPDGGILLSRNTTTTTSGEKKVTEERVTGFQPFLHGGIRFGLSRYQLISAEFTPRNRQVSPELLTYFDITYGPFSQFPRYTEEPIAGRDFSTYINGRRTNRFQVETRLKLPNAPIQIGLDYNIADTVSSREPNDWRLLIAYRGDANKLLSRIFGFVK